LQWHVTSCAGSNALTNSWPVRLAVACRK